MRMAPRLRHTCRVQRVAQRVQDKGEGAEEDDEGEDAGVEQALR